MPGGKLLPGGIHGAGAVPCSHYGAGYFDGLFRLPGKDDILACIARERQLKWRTILGIAGLLRAVWAGGGSVPGGELLPGGVDGGAGVPGEQAEPGRRRRRFRLHGT